MPRVLIIDDDEAIRRSLSRCIADMGHEALTAASLAEGLRLARSGVDVIYLDLGLPDGDGKKAVDELSSSVGQPEVIVITGLGDNYGAQETLASGAWDYIPKPASPHIVKASLAAALNYRRDRAVSRSRSVFDECGILGDAPSIRRAKELIARAAESEASVLVLGETGVGKELAAKAIHANSGRASGPFVVVDCSNLSESLVESLLYGHRKGAFTGAHADHRGLVAEADGGTLFLDEVGELPLPLQKTFLRVLQEHRFRPVGSDREQTSDFRLVAATNRDLEAMTGGGRFRSDLLFRLRTVEVALPPLRDRGRDILTLAAHFAAQSCLRYALPGKRLSPQFEKMLLAYAWPGNVRELCNVMEAAVIEAGQDPMVYPKHLPGSIRLSFLENGESRSPVGAPGPGGAARPGPAGGREDPPGGVVPYDQYKSHRDQAYFRGLMEHCGYDVSLASRVSGLSVPSVYRHLALAGISTRSGRKR